MFGGPNHLINNQRIDKHSKPWIRTRRVSRSLHLRSESSQETEGQVPSTRNLLWRKCTKLNHVSCHDEGAVHPLASTVQAHHPKARYFSAHAAKPSVAFFSSQPPELHREPKTRRRRGEPMVLPMYFSNPRRTGCGQCNQPSNQHSQM